jgi:hypothetical protein
MAGNFIKKKYIYKQYFRLQADTGLIGKYYHWCFLFQEFNLRLFRLGMMQIQLVILLEGISLQ